VYKTVLEVIADNRASGELVVLTGRGRSADWYRNIQVNSAVEVAIGRERFRAAFRVLSHGSGANVGGVRTPQRMGDTTRSVRARVAGWLAL
jgi:hypothetical protein